MIYKLLINLTEIIGQKSSSEKPKHPKSIVFKIIFYLIIILIYIKFNLLYLI